MAQKYIIEEAIEFAKTKIFFSYRYFIDMKNKH